MLCVQHFTNIGWCIDAIFVPDETERRNLMIGNLRCLDVRGVENSLDLIGEHSLDKRIPA